MVKKIKIMKSIFLTIATHMQKFPASEQHPIHTITTGTATSKMNEQNGDTADNIPFNQIRYKAINLDITLPLTDYITNWS